MVETRLTLKWVDHLSPIREKWLVFDGGFQVLRGI